MPMSNSKLQVETQDVESADLLKPLQITENPTNCKERDWAKPTSPFRSCEWLNQWVRIAMRLNLQPTTPMRPALKTSSLFNSSGGVALGVCSRWSSKEEWGNWKKENKEQLNLWAQHAWRSLLIFQRLRNDRKRKQKCLASTQQIVGGLLNVS